MFWQWFGRVADVMTILSVVLAFIIAHSLGLKFKVKEWWHQKRHGIVKSEGYVLIVAKQDNKMSVEKSVKDFMKKDTELSLISDNATGLVVTPNEFEPGNVDDFIKDFKKKRELVRENCEANVCHLFIQSPVIVGAMIGGYLYNKGEVYVYHSQGGTYIPYGRLKR